MSESTNMRFGLRDATIDRLCQVFALHGVSEVWLYGSRAKGNFHAGSDIDLTIMGEDAGVAQMGRVEIDIDDLLLPYKVDLSLFRQIDNPALREHIVRAGLEFYRAG